MKKTLSVLALLTLGTLIAGCNVSPAGGGPRADDSFNVILPREVVDIQQGAIHTLNVSLRRGDYFKQDVKLTFSETKGIDIDPNTVWIKASNTPDAQIRLSAGKDAALGEYRVSVTATPQQGQSTTTDFRVRVVPYVAPK